MDSQDHSKSKKCWITAFRVAFSEYNSPTNVPLPSVWYLNGNVTKRTFEEVVDAKAFTRPEAVEKLQFSLLKSQNSPDKIRLAIKEKDGKKDMICSEAISLISLKFFPNFIISMLRNLVSDKYLFDWVVPWLILFISLGTTFSFLVFGVYKQC